jgi:hypothetical protein
MACWIFMKRIFWQGLALWLGISSSVYASDPTHKHHNNNNIVHRKQTVTSRPFEEPPQMGNFALRVSQQPAPFIAFGQNVINKHQFQMYLYSDYFHGPDQHFTDLLPYAVYGISDNSSLLVSMPVALDYRSGGYSSHGLANATIQYEYAFYTTSTKTYEEQATVVLAGILPTGSPTSSPPTGSDTFTYFAGLTFNRTYNDWLGFVSPGVTLPTSHNGNRNGNNYIYQAGIGRNIASVPKKWLLTWMVEADGLYSSKSRASGFMNPDSGSNVIYLTPSLFYSRHNAILQVGFGVPVLQQLNGAQTLNNYFVAANIGWTF